MVLNLDKCIGCHTCSVTCKNVWTSREGIEYAWFNNVETKPGVGYPKDWENQKRWKGGWKRTTNGAIEPRIGAKWRMLANIFANPDLPEIDDYYEPFTFDYAHLQTAPEGKVDAHGASALADHRRADGEDRVGSELGGDPRRRVREAARRTAISKGSRRRSTAQFENTFMMYLPRLCEHCLNPACVAVCPSGAIYKREEDGIVLIDQDKCRGWRMCVSGMPLQEDLLQLVVGQIGEMHLLLSAHRGGPADGVLGNLRRAHPLSRRDAVRRRPHPGSRVRSGRAAISTRRSSRSSSIRSIRGSRRRPAGRHLRGLAGGREAFAGVEDGDGLEDRLSAASGIPHPADGLVRAAAVADPGRGGEGRSRRSSAACRT